MKSKKNWLYTGVIAILIGILCLSVLGYIFLNLGLLTEQLKIATVNRLESVIRKKVTVETIKTNLFNQIIFEKVKVHSDDELQKRDIVNAEKIVVNYSLWDVLTKKEVLKSSIKKIVIQRPSFFISNRNKKWNIPFITPSLSSGSSFRPVIILRNGIVDIEDVNSTFDGIRLSGLQVKINPVTSSKTKIKIVTKTNLSEHDAISIDGDIEGNQISLNFDIKDAALGKYSKHVPFGAGLYEFTGGEFGIALKISGDIENYKKLIYQGIINIKDAGVKLARLNEPITAINGDIKIDSKNLQILALTGSIMDSSFVVKGKVSYPLDTPQLDLAVNFKSIQFEDMIPLLFTAESHVIDTVSISGEGKAELTIKGPIDDLSIKSKINLKKGTMLNKPVRTLGCTLEYHRKLLNVVDLHAGLFGGKFFLNGTIDFSDATPISNMDFSSEDIDITQLIPLLRNNNINARAGIKGIMTGNLASPLLDADINLTNVNFQGKDVSSLKGTVRYQSDELIISCKTDDYNYQFNTVVRVLEDSLLIRYLNLLIDQKSKVNIVGKVGLGKNSSMELKVSSDSLYPEHFPYINKYLKGVKGAFSFDGNLSGNLKFPLLNGKLFSDHLVYIDEKMKINSVIEITKEYFKIDSFKLNEEYNGSLHLGFGEKTLLTGRINISGARLESVLRIAQVNVKPNTVKGYISADINLKGAPKNLEGKCIFTLNKASVLNIDFGPADGVLKLKDKKVYLEKFNSVINGGRISLTGETGKSKSIINDLKITVDMDDFLIGKTTLEGYFILIGKLSVNKAVKMWGDVSSSDLTINKEPEIIKLTFEYQDKLFFFNPLNFGDDYSFNGRIDFKPEKPAINGLITLHTSAPDHLFNLANIHIEREIRGDVSGKIKVSGSLSEPTFLANITAEKGNIIGFRFNELSASVVYKDKRLNIEKVVTRDSSGSFILTGSSSFNNEKGIDLDVTVVDGDVKSVADIISGGLSKKLSGRLYGSISVKGSLSKPEVSSSIQSSNLMYENLRVNKLTSVFTYSSKKVNIESLEIKEKESAFRLEKGSVITLVSEDLVAFNLKTALRNIGFNRFFLFGGSKLEGTAEFSPSGIRVISKIKPQELWINQYKIRDVELSVKYSEGKLEFFPVDGSDLKLKGEINIDKNIIHSRGVRVILSNKEAVICKGTIDHDKLDIALYTNGDGIDTEGFSDLLDISTAMSGNAIFNIKVKGSKQDPRITGIVNVEKGSFGLLKYDSLTTIIESGDDVLNFRQLKIVKKGKYTIEGQGRIPYYIASSPQNAALGQETAKEMSITLSTSKSSLHLLTALTDKIDKAEGPIDASVYISGTTYNPMINGYIRVSDGEIFLKDYVNKISGLQVDISIAQNNIMIDRINGMVGEGDFKINGSMSLIGWSIDKFDVRTLTSDEGIKLTVPGLIYKGEPRWDVRVWGTSEEYHIDGTINLVNTHFTYPPEWAKDKKKERMHKSRLFDGAIWNLLWNAGDNTWYENDLATVNVSGSLKFIGRGRSFDVDGRVEAIRGNVEYFATRFKIINAVLEFKNNKSYLEGRSEAQVRDDTITLVIDKSTLAELKPRFVSYQKPQMSQEEMVSLLVYGGNTQLGSLPEGEINKVLLKELFRLADKTLSSKVFRPILKTTGLDEVVDVFSIRAPIIEETSQAGTPTLEGSEFELGKYLNPKTYLSYKTIIHRGYTDRLELKHQIELEYRLKSHRYLRIRMDDEERFMGIENRFRF